MGVGSDYGSEDVHEPRPVRQPCPWTPVFCAFFALTFWFGFVYVLLLIYGNRGDLRNFMGPSMVFLFGITSFSFGKMMKWAARDE